LLLTTTRLRDQWHGASRSGLVGALRVRCPLSSSRRLCATIAVLRTTIWSGLLQCADNLAAGSSQRRSAGTLAVIPMHYGQRWLPSAGVNALTIGAIDPPVETTELKHAAAQIEPASFGWHLAALGWLHGEDRHSQAETLQRSGRQRWLCSDRGVRSGGRSRQRQARRDRLGGA
jgi:assimilatory nitrate reductase catalytic subunit